LQEGPKRAPLKKNPLRNLGALLKLNPYAKTARRMELLAEVRTQLSRNAGSCLCDGVNWLQRLSPL
jgi:hypothetical protein